MSSRLLTKHLIVYTFPHFVVVKIQPRFDDTGLDTYIKTCRKLKLSPIRQVCEGLATSNTIELRNRGLNPAGTLSITNALLVSNMAGTKRLTCPPYQLCAILAALRNDLFTAIQNRCQMSHTRACLNITAG